jgi:hypothetical protein
MPYLLAASAVYTIASPERLFAAADGADFLFEGKRWVKAVELRAAASEVGEHVAILFADSRDCSRLIAWTVLVDVVVGALGTNYRIGPLHQVPRSTPQQLVVLTTGRRIADGFIRPYVLCQTPSFLFAEAMAPRAWGDAGRLEKAVNEGRQFLSLHLRRERDRTLVRRLKEVRLRQHGGRLPCDVCGFDFVAAYGTLGEGFAEAHHCDPLGEAPESGRITALDDLALVCSNCHSMLHRSLEIVSVAELRDRFRRHQARRGARGGSKLP